MRILVTGASGFIGRHLVPHLEALGHGVEALRRGEGSVPADLSRIGEWRRWPEGIEAVVHLAAVSPTRLSRERDANEALMRANAEGTRALAETAAARGVRRFVFLSSAGVHSPEGARPVREDDALLRSPSAYAASKIAAESHLRHVCETSGLECVVLRPPAVYGSGTRNLFGAMARAARLPAPLLLPRSGGANLRSLLSVANLAGAVALCLDHPDAAGKTFLVADGPPLPILDVFSQMRRIFGRRDAVLPFALPAMVTQRIGCFVVDDASIRRLGYTPHQTTAEGIAQWLESPSRAKPETTR